MTRVFLSNTNKDLEASHRAAIEHFQQALETSLETGDMRNEGNQLGHLGDAYYNLEQYKRAIEYYEQALAISRETGDRRDEGKQLGNLGNAYYSLGQFERAIEYHQEALAIDHETGDRRDEGMSLGNLGNAYSDLGLVERAIEHFQQALAISREIGDRRWEANHLNNLGAVYTDQQLGFYSLALEYLQAAREIFMSLGLISRIGYVDRNIDRVEAARDVYSDEEKIKRSNGGAALKHKAHEGSKSQRNED